MSSLSPSSFGEMRPENPSWILVHGSGLEIIQQSVCEYTSLFGYDRPVPHKVSIFQLDDNRWALTFDPQVSPYTFTNLICWLNDPNMTQGVDHAVGWLTAPGSKVRYFLIHEASNPAGDTLVGIGDDGTQISVNLPDCSVSPTDDQITPLPEPGWLTQHIQPVRVFEISSEDDIEFGNPEFAVG